MGVPIVGHALPHGDVPSIDPEGPGTTTTAIQEHRTGDPFAEAAAPLDLLGQEVVERRASEGHGHFRLHHAKGQAPAAGGGPDDFLGPPR